MFKGDWRFNPPLGVGLICATLLLLAGLSNHQDNCERRHRGTEQHSADTRQCVLGFAFYAPQQAPPREPNPTRDDWREERDLQAQREMAQWAMLMLGVSVIGTIIAALGVIAVNRTLRLQYVANKDAEERFKKEHRAWLDVSFVVDGYMFYGETFWFAVHLTARNVGQSPATNVHFDIPFGGEVIFTSTQLEQFKTRLATHRNEKHLTGETVFQTGERTRTGIVRITKSRGIFGREFSVPVFVSYQIEADSLRHITPVVIRIMVKSVGLRATEVGAVADHHPLSIAPD